MSKQSSPRLVIAFAAATVAIVAAASAIFITASLPGIQGRAEHEAATVISGALVPPLATTTGPGAVDYTAFTGTATVLLSSDVRTIRLWDSQGNVLASAGDAQAAPGDRVAVAVALKRGLTSAKARARGGSVLTSYASLGGDTVLEIQQDYGPIDDAISSSTRELLLYVSIGSAALVVLFPALLWLAVAGLRRAHDRLAILHQSGQSLRAMLDLPDILGQLARDAALCARANVSLAALIEEPSQDLLVHASYNADTNSSIHLHRKVEEWFMRRCAATGEVVQAQLEQFPYGALLGDPNERPGRVNIVCVAIPGRQRPAGVLLLARMEPLGPFAAAELETVLEMASVAAMALEQATRFAEVRHRAQEVEQGYDSTLKLLSAALDTKDSITNGHSERVARLTVTLGRELSLPEEQLINIERGALLHDVGKMGMPDTILSNEGALNEIEWEAVQKHPLLAGLMVSRVDFLERALPVLLYHHERFDGTGYPFALQGKAVPIEARVFAVVDAFDAMTSDRPYRPAMNTQQALEEIERNAGTQFDPEIVDAFLRLMRRDERAQLRAA